MYHQMTMDFSEWLVNELEKRGWSRSEAARRGNISSSMFDKVINGYARPGIKFLEGIAKAFDLSLAEVINYSNNNRNEKSNLLEKIDQIVNTLSKDEQENIFEYARMRQRLAEERGKNETRRTQKRPANS